MTRPSSGPAPHDHRASCPILGRALAERSHRSGEAPGIRLQQRGDRVGLVGADDRTSRHWRPSTSQQDIDVAVGSEVPPPSLRLRSTDQDHHVAATWRVLRRCRDLPSGPSTLVADQIGRARQQPMQRRAQQRRHGPIGKTHVPSVRASPSSDKGRRTLDRRAQPDLHARPVDFDRFADAGSIDELHLMTGHLVPTTGGRDERGVGRQRGHSVRRARTETASARCAVLGPEAGRRRAPRPSRCSPWAGRRGMGISRATALRRRTRRVGA